MFKAQLPCIDRLGPRNRSSRNGERVALSQERIPGCRSSPFYPGLCVLSSDEPDCLPILIRMFVAVKLVPGHSLAIGFHVVLIQRDTCCYITRVVSIGRIPLIAAAGLFWHWTRLCLCSRVLFPQEPGQGFDLPAGKEGPYRCPQYHGRDAGVDCRIDFQRGR